MEAKKTLRIVGGMHEGARLNLAPGDYVIGSAEDCDIVLRDASVAPRHVRLTVGRSTAHLRPIDRAVVGYRGNPLRSRIKRLRDFDMISAGGAEFCLTAVDSNNAAVTDVVPKIVAPRTTGLGRAAAPYALLGLLVAGTFVVYAEAVWQGQSADGRAKAALQQARSALTGMQLNEINVTLAADNALMVSGFVHSAQDAQRLRSEKSLQVLGAPQLHYQVADEIVNRVKQHLDPAKVNVAYLGAGKVGVSGRGDAALRARLERLSKDLSGVVVIEDRITYRNSLSAQPTLTASRLPIKIVAVQIGAPSYFQDQHGARYFVGGNLSDGAQVTSISDTQIQFHKNGQTIAYSIGQDGGGAHVSEQ